MSDIDIFSLISNDPAKPQLTIPTLCDEARTFAEIESTHKEPTIYGVTDGKAVGTYFEHKFREYLAERYKFDAGNSAKGIDFPGLVVDMKFTSIKQPQSSCPFKAARQKIYGLGYALLVFVYHKLDDPNTNTGTLDIRHVIFIESTRTADFQTSSGIIKILDNDGNTDDLIAFMEERRLPIDDIESLRLAEDLIKNPPNVGYLTILNALQWRLQYSRIIKEAGNVTGIERIR